LEKKKSGYAISRTKEKGVHVTTQLFAGKVMRKCRIDEVLAPLVALAKQFREGVQLNWSKFLCKEFLKNCHEAQEQGKTFHYTQLLLSIMLIAGQLLEDSQFPNIDRDLPAAANYALL